ncbi:hypothetical protein ACQP1O_15505 [Nocardia sp. CA-151230]
MRTTTVVVLGVAAAVLVAVHATPVYWVVWSVLVVLATALWLVRR